MERFRVRNYKNTNRIFELCRLCGMDNPGKALICEQEDDIIETIIDEDDPPLARKIEVCTGIIVWNKLFFTTLD